MIRLIVAVLAVLWPAALRAEVIRVQTGEHGAFTRVVLTVPPNSDWQILRSEVGYDVILSGAEGYNLRRFFDLIPRERIANVSQSADGETLSLVVDCICRLDSFTYLDRFLVIDIRDGAPDPRTLQDVQDSPIVAEVEPATTDPIVAPKFARRDLRIGPDRLIPLLPDLVPAPAITALPTKAAVSEALAGDAETPSPEPDKTSTQDVGQISQQIAESVARALSEGVLGPAAPPLASAPLDAFAMREDLPGITARTSRQQFDEDIAAARSGTQTCLEDSYFAIEDWADTRAFHAQLRELAARTFGEERPPANEDIIALARLYLHFGFAEEAIKLIQDDGRQSLVTQSLLSIAQVLSQQDITFTILDGQHTCTNRAVLWATLAGKGDRETGPLPATLLINEYKRLPQEVGAIVGPPLAEVLLAEGDLDSAMLIMGRLPEVAVMQGPAAVARSDLERALDRPEDSAAILDEVIQDGRAVTVQVLTRRLELGAEEQAVDPGLTELADAVLFERRGTEDADTLALAQFRFHLAAGSFDRAAEMIGNGVISERALSAEMLKKEFALAAVTGMPDLPFGSYAWNGALLPGDSQALGAIAGRLDALGFGTRAAELRQDRQGGVSVAAGPPFPVEGTEPAPAVKDDPQQAAATTDRASESALTELRALVLESQASRARVEEALAQLGPPETE